MVDARSVAKDRSQNLRLSNTLNSWNPHLYLLHILIATYIRKYYPLNQPLYVMLYSRLLIASRSMYNHLDINEFPQTFYKTTLHATPMAPNTYTIYFVGLA